MKAVRVLEAPITLPATTLKSAVSLPLLKALTLPTGVAPMLTAKKRSVPEFVCIGRWQSRLSLNVSGYLPPGPLLGLPSPRRRPSPGWRASWG